MRYLILLLIVIAGCNTPLSGPSNQELLAIEQQRARIAAIFAIAKPYQHATEAERSDYNGPPRAAPPSPNRTAPAANTATPEPEPNPRTQARRQDAAGSDVVWCASPREARDAAQSQNGLEKTVLVVVIGPNCEPCERLKKNLEDPAIQSVLAESFVCALCDVETLAFDEPPSIPIFVFVPAGAESDSETVKITPPTDVDGILKTLRENR